MNFNFLDYKRIPPLEQLDELYKNTVIKLASDIKTDYCYHLIHRCELDMALTNDRKRIKKLRQLKKSAQQEWEQLKKAGN